MMPTQPNRTEVHHEPLQPQEVVRYSVMADGEPHPIETWPRTLEGVINATTRAAWLSVGRGPHEVYVGQRLLARFVDGWRAGRTRSLRAPVTASD
jgi:hypothetical protein